MGPIIREIPRNTPTDQHLHAPIVIDKLSSGTIQTSMHRSYIVCPYPVTLPSYTPRHITPPNHQVETFLIILWWKNSEIKITLKQEDREHQ